MVRLRVGRKVVAALGDTPEAVIEGMGPPTSVRDDGIKGPILEWQKSDSTVQVYCNQSKVEAIFVEPGIDVQAKGPEGDQ